MLGAVPGSRPKVFPFSLSACHCPTLLSERSLLYFFRCHSFISFCSPVPYCFPLIYTFLLETFNSPGLPTSSLCHLPTVTVAHHLSLWLVWLHPARASIPSPPPWHWSGPMGIWTWHQCTEAGLMDEAGEWLFPHACPAEAQSWARRVSSRIMPSVLAVGSQRTLGHAFHICFPFWLKLCEI